MLQKMQPQPTCGTKPLKKGSRASKRFPMRRPRRTPEVAKWPQPLQWHDPWLGPKMVRGDCLHILFCKGVLGHLLGGIIHYLCWHDGVGVVQSVAPDKRLGAPFQALTQEYQRQGTTRVTNLRMSMICDAQSPHKSFAYLDLKAYETKHFLDAFLLFARSSWTLPAPMKMPCSRQHNACLTLSPSLMMLQRFSRERLSAGFFQ